MNDIISVVVPVYKVEKFLDKCVQSILHQTYTNLEIFLVDDGSPDNCGKLCDEIAKKDSRIRVIHKMNGGLSDARNVAIPQCTGKYITFVDSDDYVEKDYILDLYNAIKKYDADISIASFCQYYLNTNRHVYVGGKKEKIYDSKNAIASMLLDKDFYTCAWGKLYKTILFDGIRYPKGKLYEDLATTYLLLMKADKIVYIPKHLYWYVQRSGSILNSSFNKKNFDLIEIVEELEKNLLNYMPEYSNEINYRVVGAYMDILRMIEKSQDKNWIVQEQILIKKIRKRIISSIKSSYFSCAVKLQIISSLLGRRAYIFYLKNYEKLKGKVNG